MRFSLSLLALLAANPSLADDYVARADIAEAVVYANLAEVVRQAELTLEPGRHRILFPATFLGFPPVIESSAGILGEVVAVPGFQIEDGMLDTDDQAAARAAVHAAENAVELAQSTLEAATSDVQAAELQQSYLQSIVEGGSNGVAMPEDAASLTAILATLGTEMANAGATLHQARQAQNQLREALADRQTELATAQAALARLAPLPTVVDMWAVTLDLDQAETVTLEIGDVDHTAGWRPVYDVHLDSETGALRMARSIALRTGGGWNNVALTLSTGDPRRPRAPSGTPPSRASVYDLQPLARTSGGLTQMDAIAEAEIPQAPMVEPVVVQDAGLGAILDGLSITYAYPSVVSTQTHSTTFLPFGEIDLQADLINRAVPRWDQSAFLIADVENSSGEPILPGEARFFRDGAVIGDGYLDFVPAGGATELPFGPLDHIQLSWTDLSRDSGDRGVFVSSNIEDRRVQVTAENLSGDPVEVQVLYATPFSEQEDLEIRIDSSRAPDQRDWQDLRGVYAWDLSLDPGAEAEITLEFEFDWPENLALDWRP